MTSQDDSSSEDEDLERFKESVDQQFLKDDFYSDNAVKRRNTIEKSTTFKQPSLRRNIEEENESYNFFRVTPDFQNYVAKHLSKKLDEDLKQCQDNLFTNEQCKHSKKKKKNSYSGIKLLHSSRHNLKVSKENSLNGSSLHTDHNLKVKRRMIEFDEEGFEERCKLVAVEAEDVIKQNDVKSWSDRSKAEIFFYKKSTNGVLELQEKPFVSISYK